MRSGTPPHEEGIFAHTANLCAKPPPEEDPAETDLESCDSARDRTGLEFPPTPHAQFGQMCPEGGDNIKRNTPAASRGKPAIFASCPAPKTSVRMSFVIATHPPDVL